MKRDISIIGIAVAVSVGLGWLLFGGNFQAGGAFTNTVNEVFLRGLRAGQNQVQAIDANGNYVAGVITSSTLNTDGTAHLGNTVLGNNDGTPTTFTTHGLLTAAMLCQDSLIIVNSSGSNIGLTLTTSSDLFSVSGCLTENGDHRKIYLFNATTSAANTVTITTSTNSGWITRKTPSTTNPFAFIGGEALEVTIMRYNPNGIATSTSQVIFDASKRNQGP